jgi:glutathionyl-hydroquinone reductase
LRASTPPIVACSNANLRRFADHANLSAYLARLIAILAFCDTFNLDHMKRAYYSFKR